jgi:creatinine amidohydrolase/Fe(II)-dependent formamide hydrolase-like protein
MVVQWEKMFVDQLEQRFREYPLVYFPYGVCEPHGPQCALGTDGLRAHGLLCKTAKTHGGIVAPASYWHMGESGGEAAWAHEAIGQVERTWFTAIPPWLFYKNLC